MKIQAVMDQLSKNGMEPYFVQTKEEALALVKQLLPAGATVSVGGSMTLKEVGVMDLLRSGDYHFLDRAAPGITPQEVQQVYIKTFAADCYLGSANAITEAGELYNVDGNANRISAMAFGPKSVIIVAGINKIVPDLQAAVRRVKTVCAPANTRRLNCNTYCKEKGHCLAVDGGMTEGCSSPQRICCTYQVLGPQRQKGRIKVILVDQSLGF